MKAIHKQMWPLAPWVEKLIGILQQRRKRQKARSKRKIIQILNYSYFVKAYTLDSAGIMFVADVIIEAVNHQLPPCNNTIIPEIKEHTPQRYLTTRKSVHWRCCNLPSWECSHKQLQPPKAPPLAPTGPKLVSNPTPHTITSPPFFGNSTGSRDKQRTELLQYTFKALPHLSNLYLATPTSCLRASSLSPLPASAPWGAELSAALVPSSGTLCHHTSETLPLPLSLNPDSKPTFCRLPTHYNCNNTVLHFLLHVFIHLQ